MKMPIRLTLALAVTALAASVLTAPTATADDLPPEIIVGNALTFTGKLSNSTAKAVLRGTATWAVTDPDGICVQTANVQRYNNDTGEITEYGVNLLSEDRSLSIPMRTMDGYAIGIQATDCDGNTTVGYQYEQWWPKLVQQNKADYSGGWKNDTCQCYSRDKTRYSDARRASATFDFTGTSVALVSVKGRNSDRVRFRVDGTRAGRADLYAGKRRVRATVWSWTGSNDNHRLVLKTQGRVDVDAFVVLRKPPMISAARLGW